MNAKGTVAPVMVTPLFYMAGAEKNYRKETLEMIQACAELITSELCSDHSVRFVSTS